jgi:hypothetical protein
MLTRDPFETSRQTTFAGFDAALVAMSQDPGGPRNGAVFIARKQLAAKMFLSEERLQECLSVLASPDDESRTQDRDGRRIEILPNGFRVLNWPGRIEGLGERHVGVHAKCSRCEKWTFGMYGEAPLCLACAKAAP